MLHELEQQHGVLLIQGKVPHFLNLAGMLATAPLEAIVLWLAHVLGHPVAFDETHGLEVVQNHPCCSSVASVAEAYRVSFVLYCFFKIKCPNKVFKIVLNINP
jgi:hypothetical protein